MKTEDYEKAVLGTESKPGSIQFGTLSTHAVLGLIAKTANIVDVAKKAMFYGKPFDLLDFQRQCEELIHCGTCLREWAESGDLTNPNDILAYAPGGLPPEIAGLKLSQINPRLLHVVLGVSSESGEMAEALTAAWEANEPVDRVNFAEETGDVFWYLGVAADALAVPFSVLFQQNITKLTDKKDGRYRAGTFDLDAAINRDLGAERGLLAGSISHNAGEVTISQAEAMSGTITAANIALESTARVEQPVYTGTVGALKSIANSALDAVDSGVDKAKTFLNK